ncbi:hypothetical protein HMI54_004932 [Coelomomyces lativittatus]|nr:hypothetical protein HMI55_004175 [Coelomomyces lativittatus]KAJ1503025.1 hypothetical protein HMI56_002376 [Coelomomyces lativittatus]KAJ1506584.1 hypothetical protein HMI54_004932 [Coelomomyces lativittatus]
MQCSLFLLIVLHLTCASAWAMATLQKIQTDAFIPSNTNQGGQAEQNILDTPYLVKRKTPFKFSIGEQEIQIFSQAPCNPQQLFVGYVAAILEDSEKDIEFNNLNMLERFNIINRNVSSIFRYDLRIKDDFFSSYFGANAEKLLRKVLENPKNWLKDNEKKIKTMLSTSDDGATGVLSCNYDGSALTNLEVTLTYFDYLMLQMTILGEQISILRETYERDTIHSCLTFSDPKRYWGYKISWSCVAKRIHEYNTANNNDWTRMLQETP